MENNIAFIDKIYIYDFNQTVGKSMIRNLEFF